MERKDAEEFTEALGMIAAGGWRQAALGERLGVPQALGLTTQEWIQERLGGYLKLSVTHRREAVAELTEEGMSKDSIAEVLGASEATVKRDRRANKGSNDPPEPPQALEKTKAKGSNDPPEPEPIVEMVCPECGGLGWVPIKETTA
jgi:DNA-binding CsgD family transcriptional regulator